jgi:hypothetical protein
VYIYPLNRNIKRSPPRCIVIYNSCKCVSIPVIEAPCIPEGKTSYSADLSWHIYVYVYSLHCWRLLGSREPRPPEPPQRSAILSRGLAPRRTDLRQAGEQSLLLPTCLSSLSFHPEDGDIRHSVTSAKLLLYSVTFEQNRYMSPLY